MEQLYFEENTSKLIGYLDEISIILCHFISSLLYFKKMNYKKNVQMILSSMKSAIEPICINYCMREGFKCPNSSKKFNDTNKLGVSTK